jgi:hypothetical protein
MCGGGTARGYLMPYFEITMKDSHCTVLISRPQHRLLNSELQHRPKKHGIHSPPSQRSTDRLTSPAHDEQRPSDHRYYSIFPFSPSNETLLPFLLLSSPSMWLVDCRELQHFSSRLWVLCPYMVSSLSSTHTSLLLT